MNAAVRFAAPQIDERAVVIQHSELVKRIAYHLAARLPSSVEVDDLIQSGMIGLLDAARHYDDSAGASFETYAGIRIRGAMVDELRSGDWAPRSVHKKVREATEMVRKLEQERGRAVREVDVAEQLGISIDDYRMEAYLDGHMLFFTHYDMPGIIGKVGTVFGKHGVNIGQMSVGRVQQQQGGLAIGVLNLDSRPPKEALEELISIDGIKKVQWIELPAAGVLPPWLA